MSGGAVGGDDSKFLYLGFHPCYEVLFAICNSKYFPSFYVSKGLNQQH